MQKKITFILLFLIGLFIFQTSFAQKKEKMPQGIFLFEGDKAILLEQSIPNLRKLRKLMKRNKGMVIELSGHTNGCSSGKNKSEELSFRRAEVIKAYLVNKKIAYERIKVRACGCNEMLFRHPRSSKEEQANRRVEVTILSY